MVYIYAIRNRWRFFEMIADRCRRWTKRQDSLCQGCQTYGPRRPAAARETSKKFYFSSFSKKKVLKNFLIPMRPAWDWWVGIRPASRHEFDIPGLYTSVLTYTILKIKEVQFQNISFLNISFYDIYFFFGQFWNCLFFY